ncbi:MAG: thymidylate synthase [Thermodesulfobacteriota bacterium]
MEFKPLYFADRLTVINPHGAIGVVTLWSKVDYVIERFREAGVDLNPDTSPIAVFGTLYGNGLREMLRNLLYNPQIQLVLICGHDRSGSRDELINFFANGLEIVEESNVSYLADSGAATNPYRIKGTRRLLDGLVQPELFATAPEIKWLGDPAAPTAPGDLGKASIPSNIRTSIANYRPRFLENLVRPDAIPPLPQVETLYFPSNPRAHQVVQEKPLDAYLDLIFLITRFGRRVTLKKGERLELQNIKVVVEKPEFELDKPDFKEKLLAVNIDDSKIGKYYLEFLQGELRQDESYNYGHRLRKYFEIDAVQELANRLKADPEDRKAYFALWDSYRDLTGKVSRPCFVSAFFRKFEEKLTLTATFRTHNALDAWLLNFYGLMRLQSEVAKEAVLPPGAITVFSQSISIDPKELDRAMMVAGKRKWKMHLDPMGYFRVTLDGPQILVEHRFEDVTLTEYRGKTAVSLQHQIARDVALSDINHAIYLGRQLAKAEMALKEGREFVQD